MAICIKEDIGDEEILKEAFEVIVIDYCDNFHSFINGRRGNHHHKKVYKSLIYLYEKWK
ncbi:MAG: DUF4760 domain-containing protein [Symploca sp. SIO2C1]|nr:DUF4760 domain-containing protein [Symploca sp. SIO2C1]